MRTRGKASTEVAGHIQLAIPGVSTVVDSNLVGVSVPKVATPAELCEFVESVYHAAGDSCVKAGDLLLVSSATVWKIVRGRQKDSQLIRDTWNIRRNKARPRVWMRTDNVQLAVKILMKHYPNVEVTVHECNEELFP